MIKIYLSELAPIHGERGVTMDALAEDGTVVMEVNAEDMTAALIKLGYEEPESPAHAQYRELYPEYTLVHVSDPNTHEGFQRASAANWKLVEDSIDD